MNIQDVFILAKKQNVELRLDNGQLKYRAPTESLSPELLQIFRQQKERLIHALSRDTNNVSALFPLSYNQKSLWLLDQLVAQSTAYTVLAACLIRGPVNTQALMFGLETVVERHEALRMTYDFWPDGSGPCQYVHTDRKFHFRHIEARGWTDAALRENINACVQEPFQLSKGPLMRTCLFSLSAHKHILVFAVHHIACDRASMAMYIDEILQAYRAKDRSVPLQLPTPQHDYRDYIIMQNELLSSDRGAELLAYWQKALAGMPDAIDLPADKPYPPNLHLRGASIVFEADAEQVRAVKARAQAAGVTPGALLLAAFALMLMRVSGKRDLGIAVAASGRTKPEHSSICGYCVNPVVIRCMLEHAQPQDAFLQRIAKRLLQALDHQEYPFSLLVEKLSPRRHPGRQPLAQVFFNFMSRQSLGVLKHFYCPSQIDEPLQVGQLQLTPFVLPQQEGQYELALDCIEDKGTIFCTLKYSTDIFTYATAKTLASQYRETLAELTRGTPAVLEPVLLPGNKQHRQAASDQDQTAPAVAGAPALDLPTDRPRSAQRDSSLDGSDEARLAASLVKKMDTFSRLCNCDWPATACAAFAVLLYRLSSSPEISFAVSAGGGKHPVEHRMLALAVNPELPFGDFIHTARAALSQAAPQAAPGPATAVFSTALPAVEESAAPGPCDLYFHATPSGKSITLNCRYQTRLFDAGTIQQWLAAYRLLLHEAITRPDKKLWQLQLMEAGLRKKILHLWNDTDLRFAPAKNLSILLDRQAAKTPWAPALKMDGRSITYTEFGLRASALAVKLQQHGVGPDAPVGVCARRSLEMVIGLAAVLKAGGAYVPLDPELPKIRLAAMLDDCRPPVILVQPSCRASLPVRANSRIIELDYPAATTETKQLQSLPAPARLSRENLTYIIFTSGSTGTPKGVMNTHGGICNRLLWMQQQYQLTPEDRVLQKTPFGFDVSVWEFFWPLMTGACLVVSPPGAHRDPARLKKLIEAERISIIHFVPSMLRLFLEDRTPADLSSLRHVIVSGETLPAELQRLFFQTMPQATQLHNLYGPTEAAVDVSFWQCRRDDKRSFVPIGRPIANTSLYILDKWLQPVLPGVAGELHIGGVGLARGYINNQLLTDEKFIRSPFSTNTHQRLYRTGDRARFLPDGTIDCLGRLDGQVKVRGCRIELGEIEAVLLQHDLVAGAVVQPVAFSQHDLRLCAYITLHPGSPPQTALHTTLLEYLRLHVPDYMIPASFTVLDEFPLTPSGKVDRKALPRPVMTRPTESEKFIAPSTMLEHMLVDLWKRHLQIDAVGVADNFFDLGGTSLLLAQIAAGIKAATGLDLPLTELFEFPTIASLAGHMHHEHAQSAGLTAAGIRAKKTKAALAHIQRHDSKPLRHESQAQQKSPARESGPLPATAIELFEAQVGRNPGRRAATFQGESLTYTELNHRANQLGRFLRRLGMGPEKLAGIYLERSLDMLIAVLGVLKSGGAYVPLDPAFPRERLEFMTRDAGLQVLITEKSLAGNFAEGCSAARVLCDTQRDRIAAESEENPGRFANGENLAYVIYTSGSTGKPKGVEIEQRALVNFLTSMQREPGFGPDDVLLALTTLSFDIAGLELLLPLAAGGRLEIARRQTALDGRLLQQLLQKSGATVLQATPVTWRMLLDAGWCTRQQPLKALCGGEALTRELADRILTAGAQLWNMYGPTETTIWSMVSRVAPGAGEPDLGRPIAGTQIYVLDESLQPVPPGEIGELCIAGAGLARGYRNLPNMTGERFLKPLPGRDRLYRTGDLVRQHKETLAFEFLGRCDQQVKLRGFRIELGEIESVLVQHGAVACAAAAVLKDGRGEDRIVGYVTVRPGAQPTVHELRQFMQARVPDYMIPDFFMVLEKLALTPNGKIDRKALPAPDMSRSAPVAPYIAPGSGMEKLVAAVWKKILDVEQIGAQDNFFDLGGNSLLLIQACRMLEHELGSDVAPTTLFQYPTVAALAAYFDAGQTQPALDMNASTRARQQRMAAKKQQRLKHSVRVHL